MKSSANLQTSSSASRGEILLVVVLLALVVAASAWWNYQEGYLLYYGDAEAHLKTSRSVFDSRRPGFDQLGTVWLPMLHLLCLPFVQNMTLWSTGLAATIPVACCSLIAGLFLYLTVRCLQQSIMPAAVAVFCFALNPNILYLSVLSMTEAVFLAGLAVLVYTGVRFRTKSHPGLLATGIAASCWMSLTRYDGWFLIPFAAGWFAYSARMNRIFTFLLFATLASLVPAGWMAHGWWETGNAFDFFNGPYSAKAIQHGEPYPGFHDWPNAFLYYGKAAQLCAGWGLAAAALFGLLVTRTKDILLPTTFLFLPCVFYIWSIHSSGNPIHVPQLWPFTYYNSRYGIAFVFFAAFVAGTLTHSFRGSLAKLAFIVPFVAVVPWLIQPSREHWICWKESEYNSVARRAWTNQAAQFLAANYQTGQGILAPFSDVSCIFGRARIPLAQVLHEGDGTSWLATTRRPDLLHQQLWAIAQQGDILDRSLSGPLGHTYSIVKQIRVKDAPILNIYKRNFDADHPFH